MKLKASLFALAAMFMAFLLTGCYTQMAKPDRSEDRPEYSESTTEEDQEYENQEYQDQEDSYREYDHVTNVYIYDDFYARRYSWNRWDPWDAWSYRYQRYGWNMHYSYYANDYWNWWCGTPWDRYYDPWWNYRYSSWGTGWGGYSPYWGNSTRPRDRAVVNEKRPFGRRSSGGDDGGGVSRRGSSSGSLNKSGETVYARGDDGVYRRTRRTDTESVRDTRTDGNGSGSDNRRVSRRGAVDTRSDEVISTPSTGGSSVARPARTRETPTEAKQPATSSDRRSSKREGSESGKVSRRSNNSGSSSATRGSSSGSSVGSSKRSSNSGNSGGSSSGVSRSGNSSSGSSSKGSSSSGSSSSSSNNNSSGGSNRRSKN